MTNDVVERMAKAMAGVTGEWRNEEAHNIHVQLAEKAYTALTPPVDMDEVRQIILACTDADTNDANYAARKIHARIYGEG